MSPERPAPVYPLQRVQVSSLDDQTVGILAALLVTGCALSGPVDDVRELSSAQGTDPDRRVIGFVRPYGLRSGEAFVARHNGDLHDEGAGVYVREGSAVFCLTCLVGDLLDCWLDVTPAALDHLVPLIAQVAGEQPWAAMVQVDLCDLVPWLSHWVGLRDAEAES